MKDCNASKIKLLHELSKLHSYIGTYASVHSENAGHPACSSLYGEMQDDLEKHMGSLKKAIAGLANEGKF